MTATALITIAAGRHHHLALQRRALQFCRPRPATHALVSMGDSALASVAYRSAPDGPRISVASLSAGRRLPLAAARNTGAAVALDAGADLLVFLDVDCVPHPKLFDEYRRAATEHPSALLCGPVTYLPPPSPGGYELQQLRPDPHSARPAPPPGTTELTTQFNLFWSLSFAVTGAAWARIGGFCEAYEGYGGEDTDFALAAQAAGLTMAWVGGAHAFHQYHPVSSPPVEHLDDILRNGRIFADRWGFWPMQGWLDGFFSLGLVVPDGEGGWRAADSDGRAAAVAPDQ